jgi:hypothetical protein
MTDQNDYVVLRHSGRHGAKWRTLYRGADWQRAAAVYETTQEALRQGAVRLICSCGDVLRSCSAPTLRTRW